MGHPEVGGSAAGDAAQTARAVTDNAKRLGLTWTRRIATVIDPDTPTAIFDGDLVPLRMTSMVGYALVAGNRVYVDIIPPSGLFILGRVGVPSATTYRDRQTLTAVAASVTFSGIPATLRLLRLTWYARSTRSAAGIDSVQVRINGSAAASYGIEYTQGQGAATASALVSGATSFFFGYCPDATAGATNYGPGNADFMGWDAGLGSLGVRFGSASFTAGGLQLSGGGNFFVAGPYTSLTILPGVGPNFAAGSDFQIEGVYA